MSRARLLYRLQLALALSAAGAVLASALLVLTRLRPGLPAAGDLWSACQQMVPLEPSRGPLLLLALAVVGFGIGARGARSLWRRLAAGRRFLAGLRVVEHRRIGEAMAAIIDHDHPQAFCSGLLRPRIYVSTATLAVLEPAELEAVIAHESHHAMRRDPLRMLAAEVLADTFFFLPALGHLARRYRQLAEVAADAAAINAGGTAPLASALLRFSDRPAAAKSGIGITAERVEHLLGEPPPLRLPLAALAGSLAAVAGLLAVAIAGPAWVPAGSVSLATMLTETCTAVIVLTPIAIGVAGSWGSVTWIRNRLQAG